MAGERDARRSRMDLNLYLGLPRSPRHRSLDFGSDLALSSLLPISATEENAGGDATSTAAMDLHQPYSPEHSSFVPLRTGRAAIFTSGTPLPTSPDYLPYTPPYEGYGYEYPPYPLVMSPPLPGVSDDAGPYQLILDQLDDMEETNIEATLVEDAPEIEHVEDEPVEDEPIEDEPVEDTPVRVEDHSVIDRDLHRPYSPPYVAAAPTYRSPYLPASVIPDNPDELGFSFHPSPHSRLSGYMDSGTPSSAQPLELSPRRQMETELSWTLSMQQQIRSTLMNIERTVGAGSSSAVRLQNSELERHPSTSVDDNGKHKLPFEAGKAGASEDDEGHERAKTASAACFDCNICFDMADEPVVTSCGHLFCWPCLYQWLHIHSDHKECPVCKGEVADTNITPIYGRGGSTAGSEKHDEAEISGIKIPPRPHGNRVESIRQQMRPYSRFASSWRRILDQHMRTATGFEAAPELDATTRRAITRLRARRISREEGPSSAAHAIGGSGSHESAAVNSTGSAQSSLFREGLDIWHRFTLYGLSGSERLAAITAGLTDRFASSSSGIHREPSTSSNPRDPGPAGGRNTASSSHPDQASTSSTMAVIQGEGLIPDHIGEPSNEGSMTIVGRAGRGRVPGSLDADGGGLNGRKRRRLN